VVNAFPELAGNLVHDARTVVVMREHGVSRICTRNSDFRRFDFLTVIDPLRPALGGSQ
jgi:predicted nucleic acid-binding protein